MTAAIATTATGVVVGPWRAALLALENHWVWYRRNWRATVISSFLQPVLFLLAMGIGFGSQVQPGEATGGLRYAVYLAPALLITPLPSDPGGLLWLVLLGIVHTALMYVLMYGSIGKLPTGTVALLSYVYPVVALVVDVLAYGHKVTWLEGLGMAAVLIAALAPKRRVTRG